MVKQPACAAAISSSGLVPFSFSTRVLKEYGVSASTPDSVERFPLPARPVPRQTAFALRIMLHILPVACSKRSRIHRGAIARHWSSAHPNRILFVDYSDCFNAAVSTGILRSRLPVAAKIALVTAGTMHDVPH